MDVRKIGRIPDGGGWRAHGRAMGSTGARKRARIGYDFVHSVVDDYTRMAYPVILPDEKGATCAAFLARAAAALVAAGVQGSNGSSPTTTGPTATHATSPRHRGHGRN